MFSARSRRYRGSSLDLARRNSQRDRRETSSDRASTPDQPPPKDDDAVSAAERFTAEQKKTSEGDLTGALPFKSVALDVWADGVLSYDPNEHRRAILRAKMKATASRRKILAPEGRADYLEERRQDAMASANTLRRQLSMAEAQVAMTEASRPGASSPQNRPRSSLRRRLELAFTLCFLRGLPGTSEASVQMAC